MKGFKVNKFLTILSIFLLFSCSSPCNHNYVDIILTEPTCTEEGKGQHECSKCHHIEEYVIPALGHNFSEWKIIYPATYEEDGLQERYCLRCDYSEEQTIPKLPYTYKITLDHGMNEEYVYVQADGVYHLNVPSKPGQTFIKYIDDNGDVFPLDGIINQNLTIHSIWTVTEITTFDELKNLIEQEAELIKIASDITLTETLYVTNTTKIISSGNYSLIRATNFLDDLFVIGEDENGHGSIFDDKNACLILGDSKSNSTLTIDGNKDNVSGDVSGSALFISYSASCEINNGVTIENCRKTTNEKVLSEKYHLSYPEFVGGSVAIIADGVLNIYGGIFTDNEVNTDVTEADDSLSCRGGLFYNFSNLNIYDGVFSNNKATKGGAVFSYKTVNILTGKFENNSATMYGGAIYLPGSQYACTYLGIESNNGNEPVLNFNENTAVSFGGAIYAGTHSGIIIKGLTSFSGNTVTDSSKGYGGAIHTKGTLLANNAVFENNTATSRGGAIHTMDNDDAATTRINEIKNCSFSSNSAKNGGAINFYANSIATVDNCSFVGNTASNEGNGGAIYASGNGDDPLGFSNVTINDSTFDNNNATKGGAIYITSKANITTDNCHFVNNTSIKTGGAIYIVSIGSKAIINQTEFKNNSATTNGGAMYCTTGSYTEINDSAFTSNSAASGGAMYIVESGTSIKIDNSTFTSNTSSGNGGALYLYTSIIAEISNTSFVSNTVTSTGKYGGAMYISGKANVTLKQIIAHENSASSGGFIYITTSETTLNIDMATVYDNAATTGTNLYSNSDGTIIKIHKNTIVDKDGNVITTDVLVTGKTGGVEEYE